MLAYNLPLLVRFLSRFGLRVMLTLLKERTAFPPLELFTVVSEGWLLVVLGTLVKFTREAPSPGLLCVGCF